MSIAYREMLIRRKRNLSFDNVSKLLFRACVNTTLSLTNNNGMFVISSNGGTGNVSEMNSSFPDLYFGPTQHGMKYSLDNGNTWNNWIFENGNLNLTNYFSNISSVNKKIGRDIVQFNSSSQQIIIDDSLGSYGEYLLELIMEPTTTSTLTVNVTFEQ